MNVSKELRRRIGRVVKYNQTISFTPDERQAVIADCLYCSEGSERSWFTNLTDKELAVEMVRAWHDFCVDKGLI